MLALLVQELKTNGADRNTSVYCVKDKTDPTKMSWKLGALSPLQRFCVGVTSTFRNTPDDIIQQKQLDSSEAREAVINELESRYGKAIVDKVLNDTPQVPRDSMDSLKVHHVSALTAGCKTLSEQKNAALNHKIKTNIEKNQGLESIAKTVIKNSGMDEADVKLVFQKAFKASLRDHFDNLLEKNKAKAACSPDGSGLYMEDLAENRQNAFDKLMQQAVKTCFESRKDALEASFPGITTHVPNLQYSADPIEMVKTHLDVLFKNQQLSSNVVTTLQTLLTKCQEFNEVSTTPVCTLKEIGEKEGALTTLRLAILNSFPSPNTINDDIAFPIFEGCLKITDSIEKQLTSFENLKKTAADSQAVVHQHAGIAYRTGANILSAILLDQGTSAKLNQRQKDKIGTALASLTSLATKEELSLTNAHKNNLARDTSQKLSFVEVERDVEKKVKDALKGTFKEKIDYLSTYRNERLQLMEAKFSEITHLYSFQKNNEMKQYVNTLTPANKIPIVSNKYIDATTGAVANPRSSGNREKGGGHAINMWSSVLVDQQSLKPVFKAIKHAICCAFRISDDSDRAKENIGMATEVVHAGIGIDAEFQQRAIANSNNPAKSNIKNRQLLISCSLTSPHVLTSLDAHNAERKMTDEQQAAFNSLDGQTLQVDVPDPTNTLNPTKTIEVEETVIQFCFGTNDFATMPVLRDSTWAHVAAKNRENMVKLFGNTKAGTSARGETGDILSALQVAYNKPGISDDKKKQIVQLIAEITHHADTVRKIYETEDYKRNDGDVYKMPRNIGLLANALSKAGEFIESVNLTVTNASGCKSACDRGGNNIICMMAEIVMRAFGSLWRPGKELHDDDKSIVTTFAMGPETNHSNAANRSVGAAKSAIQILALLLKGEVTVPLLGGNGIEYQVWS